MQNRSKEPGRDELRAARRQSRPYFWFVAIFSFFVNLLMLTGPLYMLQIYDRVLSSRNEMTLIMISAIAIAMLVSYGLLEFTRSRLLVRAEAAV